MQRWWAAAGGAVPAGGTSALHSAADVALALVALAALLFWRVPPWAVVVATALAGWGLQVLLPSLI
jgi:chromate transporter